FGSGLNSMQLLSHFEPSFIKIDRTFVQELSKTPENQKRIRELAEKAKARDIHTIAEFVEDASSMSNLFTSGVDYVQGNFLAGPGPEMNYEFE
ncbi:MAG: EAL domain-containing protein, partial [Pseudomonadota bacterium]|nr:EAL domain-containing protein [Pseudomonadota bacterium]